MKITFKQGDTVAIPEGCTATIKDGVITFTIGNLIQNYLILAIISAQKNKPKPLPKLSKRF